MWTYYSLTVRRLVCCFLCAFKCGHKWHFWCVLCRGVITGSTTVLLAELCAVCPRMQQLGHGQPLTSPALHETFPGCYLSSWEVPVQVQGWWKWFVTLLSSSHMGGWCFSLDFSPGCHVDLEIAAGFCITGGFFCAIFACLRNSWASVEGAAH